MKRTILALAAGLCLASFAAPSFVTGRMIDRRNGLTDAQYEALWRIGRNPAVSQNVARDWAFRASRYQNVTNWLDICGATNNFAALSYDLQGKNFVLEETNAVVVAENKELAHTNIVLVAENEMLIETNAVLQVDAYKAQRVTKAAEKAKKKDSKTFANWVKDTKKAREKSTTEEMVEFYDSILDLAHAVEYGISL